MIFIGSFPYSENKEYLINEKKGAILWTFYLSNASKKPIYVVSWNFSLFSVDEEKTNLTLTRGIEIFLKRYLNLNLACVNLSLLSGSPFPLDPDLRSNKMVEIFLTSIRRKKKRELMIDQVLFFTVYLRKGLIYHIFLISSIKKDFFVGWYFICKNSDTNVLLLIF